MPGTHKFLEPQGLFVAKYRIRQDDPTILEASYYCDSYASADDHAPRFATLRSNDAAIDFPGRYSLTSIDAPGAAQSLDIEIVRGSTTGLEIAFQQSGKRVARGLGVIDPADGQALLVSGWTAETEPYGIAKYWIHDARTIEGYYLSKMSPDQPGRDTAAGDTSGGFPGSYSLTTREVNGRTWGPHDWRLARRGELIDLVWRDEGRVICRGFGLPDPRDSRSIIVNYIPVSE